MSEDFLNIFNKVDEKIQSNSSQEFLELFLTVTEQYENVQLTPKIRNEILCTLEESIKTECDISEDCHNDDISTFVDGFAEHVLYTNRNKINGVNCIIDSLKSRT